MMTRNYNVSLGLCNGTRFKIIRMTDHIIEVEILTGDHKGENAIIHRITHTVEDKKLPFTFTRHQFPLKLAFAMTINKSQGQTFKHVGLYLVNNVFAHGQLYVGFSRVRKMSSLRVALDPNREHNRVKNIVYKELLHDD